MELTGAKFKELHDAILSAFDYSSLQMMLRLKLDKRLEQFTPSADLQTVVFTLISTAEREGWVYDLARAAHESVPGNPSLAAVAASLSQVDSTTTVAAPGAEPAEPPLSSPVPAIDVDHPPIRQIRTLLRNAYSATTLRQFCNDRDEFRDVLFRIGPDQGLDDVIDEVLEYCRTQLLWQKVIEEVAQEHPRHFQRFLEQL